MNVSSFVEQVRQQRCMAELAKMFPPERSFAVTIRPNRRLGRRIRPREMIGEYFATLDRRNLGRRWSEKAPGRRFSGMFVPEGKGNDLHFHGIVTVPVAIFSASGTEAVDLVQILEGSWSWLWPHTNPHVVPLETPEKWCGYISKQNSILSGAGWYAHEFWSEKVIDKAKRAQTSGTQGTLPPKATDASSYTWPPVDEAAPDGPDQHQLEAAAIPNHAFSTVDPTRDEPDPGTLFDVVVDADESESPQTGPRTQKFWSIISQIGDLVRWSGNTAVKVIARTHKSLGVTWHRIMKAFVSGP